MNHEPILEPKSGKEALRMGGFETIEKFIDHAIKELPGFYTTQYIYMAFKMKCLEEEGCDPLMVFKIWKKRLLIETYKKTFDGYHSVRDDAMEEVLNDFDRTFKICMEYEKSAKDKAA